MNKEIITLINECQELIRIYYSPFLKMNLNDLASRLDKIKILIKETYPIYYEELSEAMTFYEKHKHNHNMGCIDAILSIIQKQEKANTSRKIFISHSSKDKTIVANFVDIILQLGIGIHPNDIFCTSIEETGIRTGEDIRQHIKSNIKGCDYAFLMISENYNKSHICLNEMGAVWALDRNVKPFLINTDFEKLSWLYTPNIASPLNESGALDKLHDEFSEKYNFSKQTTSWNRHRDNFLKTFS